MQRIDHVYVNGQFVRPHGSETMQLVDPVSEEVASVVTLADEVDAQAAIAAAVSAYRTYRWSTLDEREAYLQRLHDAVRARADELTAVMQAEYGGPAAVCRATVKRASDYFVQAQQAMRALPWQRMIGTARVVMEPLGVVGIITPWNASYGFVCCKLATALAAGSTAVIKPSELSAAQTQILTECLHAAQLPPGLFNVVTGTGDAVGSALVNSPDIAKISFTGSTAVGKRILRDGAQTLKRVTLELGGKSPNVILPGADLDAAVPLALRLAYANSGQACIAGTRLLVPAAQLDDISARLARAVTALRVGAGDVDIGPMVNRRQWERVQGYIQLGLDEGAHLLAGGVGRPAHLPRGYFVQPTIFTRVTPEMRIAREEIFGPVLSVLTYDTVEDAVALANDTVYGLQAYVSGPEAARVAAQLVAGRVMVNGQFEEPLAPFGGFKQSGIGREFGELGLAGYLEPKAILG